MIPDTFNELSPEDDFFIRPLLSRPVTPGVLSLLGRLEFSLELELELTHYTIASC